MYCAIFLLQARPTSTLTLSTHRARLVWKRYKKLRMHIFQNTSVRCQDQKLLTPNQSSLLLWNHSSLFGRLKHCILNALLNLKKTRTWRLSGTSMEKRWNMVCAICRTYWSVRLLSCAMLWNMKLMIDFFNYTYRFSFQDDLWFWLRHASFDWCVWAWSRHLYLQGLQSGWRGFHFHHCVLHRYKTDLFH